MTMQLEEVKVQGGSGALMVMHPACVCGTSTNTPTRLAQPTLVPLCGTCGGSQPRSPETVQAVRRQNRQLQDFLNAFV